MLKKNEVIEILEKGGHITLCDIYRTAHVYNAAGARVDTCRFDTAERIGSAAPYKVRNGGAWTYTRYIENPAAVEAAREAAAEELEEITTPGNIVLQAKANGNCGSYRIQAGRTYIITVYGDGSHDVPGNAYGKLYDFRADRDAIKFEIIERPAEEPQQPNDDAQSARVEAATRAALERAGVLCEESAAAQEAPAVEPDPQSAPPVKVYSNERTDECTARASVALGWHRDGDAVQVHTRDAYWGELLHRVTIPGAPQEPERREDENRAHCRHIAEEIDAYAAGEFKRCPDCGEIHRRNWDDIADAFRCPNCGSVGSVDEWDTLSLWEFFDDAYDIEYRVGSDLEYRSVRVMVACGGPNIYIDTASKNVELYWWGERAWYPISYDAVEIIDEWAEELYKCR